jgi:sterol desaturase/sphingolipid hydroxylase (fatty acid hydroxylase superfamily)
MFYPSKSILFHYVYPVFVSMILLEAIATYRQGKNSYSWRESLASFGIAIGQHLSNVIFIFIPISILSFVWEHRLFTIELNSAGAFFSLFMGVEFCYYWYHRSAHQIRWLWATHAVHHSARYFNLSAAYRLGWTNWLSGNILFFTPLCWLGFHPIAVTATLGLNLLYQFWIHTDLIPPLGIIELIFNTPNHHRIHHASNPEYLDRNFGGVLIIFDRLFGTFISAKPSVKPIYGLTHPLHSYNPLKIAFHEWINLFQDLQQAKSLPDRFFIAFRPNSARSSL